MNAGAYVNILHTYIHTALHTQHYIRTYRNLHIVVAINGTDSTYSTLEYRSFYLPTINWSNF
jgi:hypothetical protein